MTQNIIELYDNVHGDIASGDIDDNILSILYFWILFFGALSLFIWAFYLFYNILFIAEDEISTFCGNNI